MIVFGDHTRAFKFVDFPFATGADGTKLLRANEDLIDPRFFYYALLHLPLPSRGYNRHFKYLREQEILVPTDNAEQRAIAGVLAKVQAAVEVQEKIVARLRELKAATMAKLFHEGLRGEPLKQTEIGEIPQSWDVVCIGDLVKLRSGESRPNDLSPRRTDATPFPVYGGNGVMGYSSHYLTRQESIVIGRVGVYCGSVHVSPPYSWVTDNALYNRDPLDERIFFHFFAELLAYIRLNRLHRKEAQPLVTQGTVHTVKIQSPPRPEQEEIARIARELNKRIEVAQQKLDALKLTFFSMLHLLMTGRVRVTRKMIALQALADRAARRPKWSGKVGEKVLEEIVRRIVEAAAPEKIVLFGSAARGEMGPDSDLDLLVVKPCDRPREEARIIRRNLIGTRMPIDLLVVTPEHLEKHKDTIGYIYRPALREGKVIYAA